jgi:hypothetical protein
VYVCVREIVLKRTRALFSLVTYLHLPNHPPYLIFPNNNPHVSIAAALKDDSFSQINVGSRSPKNQGTTIPM